MMLVGKKNLRFNPFHKSDLSKSFRPEVTFHGKVGKADGTTVGAEWTQKKLDKCRCSAISMIC